MRGLMNSRIDATGSGSHPVKNSAKSRDPRLRFINSDASTLDLNQTIGANNMSTVEYPGKVISRKQKTEDPSLDATAPKRLRRSLENSEHNTREERTTAGKGGWFEENTVAGSQLIERNHLMQKRESELERTMSTSSGNLTVTSDGNEQAPITGSSTTASIPTTAPLPVILQNMAVNPTILMNILLEQQQRLAAESQKKPVDSATSILHLTNSNSARGTDTTVNTGPAMTAGLPQSSVGILPVSSPATSTVKSFYEIISLEVNTSEVNSWYYSECGVYLPIIYFFLLLASDN
jgi:RNA polymerase II C-terminal domain phosphatase-like 3/4